MAQIDVTVGDGNTVTFEIDTDLDGPAYFLLSIRKCGSSLFSKIGGALARVNERPVIDLGDRFFAANVKEREWCNAPSLRGILHPGHAYSGIRMLPTSLLEAELFQSSPKLLLVRDLRDALVSEYFSNAYSHPIPEPGETSREVTDLMLRQRDQARAAGIDEVVLKRSRLMLQTAMEYEAIIDSPSLTLLRYEDYIFEKAELITLIADRFGWDVNDELIRRILDWADVRPEQEDPTRFIRQVAPGDHLQKLRPDTIAELTEILQPALELFGYPVRV